jgi:hypothetical protein
VKRNGDLTFNYPDLRVQSIFFNGDVNSYIHTGKFWKIIGSTNP